MDDPDSITASATGSSTSISSADSLKTLQIDRLILESIPDFIDTISGGVEGEVSYSEIFHAVVDNRFMNTFGKRYGQDSSEIASVRENISKELSGIIGEEASFTNLCEGLVNPVVAREALSSYVFAIDGNKAALVAIGAENRKISALREGAEYSIEGSTIPMLQFFVSSKIEATKAFKSPYKPSEKLESLLDSKTVSLDGPLTEELSNLFADFDRQLRSKINKSLALRHIFSVAVQKLLLQYSTELHEKADVEIEDKIINGATSSEDSEARLLDENISADQNSALELFTRIVDASEQNPRDVDGRKIMSAGLAYVARQVLAHERSSSAWMFFGEGKEGDLFYSTLEQEVALLQNGAEEKITVGFISKDSKEVLRIKATQQALKSGLTDAASIDLIFQDLIRNYEDVGEDLEARISSDLEILKSEGYPVSEDEIAEIKELLIEKVEEDGVTVAKDSKALKSAQSSYHEVMRAIENRNLPECLEKLRLARKAATVHLQSCVEAGALVAQPSKAFSPNSEGVYPDRIKAQCNQILLQEKNTRTQEKVKTAIAEAEACAAIACLDEDVRARNSGTDFTIDKSQMPSFEDKNPLPILPETLSADNQWALKFATRELMDEGLSLDNAQASEFLVRLAETAKRSPKEIAALAQLKNAKDALLYYLGPTLDPNTNLAESKRRFNNIVKAAMAVSLVQQVEQADRLIAMTSQEESDGNTLLSLPSKIARIEATQKEIFAIETTAELVAKAVAINDKEKKVVADGVVSGNYIVPRSLAAAKLQQAIRIVEDVIAVVGSRENFFQLPASERNTFLKRAISDEFARSAQESFTALLNRIIPAAGKDVATTDRVMDHSHSGTVILAPSIPERLELQLQDLREGLKKDAASDLKGVAGSEAARNAFDDDSVTIPQKLSLFAASSEAYVRIGQVEIYKTFLQRQEDALKQAQEEKLQLIREKEEAIAQSARGEASLADARRVFEENLAEVSNRISVLELENDRLRLTLTAKEAENAALKDRLNTLTTQLTTATELNTTLQAKKLELEGTISANEIAISQAAERERALEAAKDQAERARAEAVEENQRLLQAQTEAEAARKVVEQEASAAHLAAMEAKDRELVAAQARAASAEANASQKDQEVEGLTNSLRRLEEEKSAIEKRVTNLNAEVASLTEQLSLQEVSIENLNLQITTLSAENNLLSELNSALLSEKEGLIAAVSRAQELRAAEEAARQRAEQATSDHRLAEEAAREISSEAVYEKEAALARERIANEAKEKAEKDLVDALEAGQRAESEKNEALARVSVLEAEVALETVQVEVLQSGLTELQQQLYTVSSERDRLKDTNTALEEAIRLANEAKDAALKAKVEADELKAASDRIAASDRQDKERASDAAAAALVAQQAAEQRAEEADRQKAAALEERGAAQASLLEAQQSLQQLQGELQQIRDLNVQLNQQNEALAAENTALIQKEQNARDAEAAAKEAKLLAEAAQRDAKSAREAAESKSSEDAAAKEAALKLAEARRQEADAAQAAAEEAEQELEVARANVEALELVKSDLLQKLEGLQKNLTESQLERAALKITAHAFSQYVRLLRDTGAAIPGGDLNPAAVAEKILYFEKNRVARIAEGNHEIDLSGLDELDIEVCKLYNDARTAVGSSFTDIIGTFIADDRAPEAINARITQIINEKIAAHEQAAAALVAARAEEDARKVPVRDVAKAVARSLLQKRRRIEAPDDKLVDSFASFAFNEAWARDQKIPPLVGKDTVLLSSAEKGQLLGIFTRFGRADLSERIVFSGQTGVPKKPIYCGKAILEYLNSDEGITEELLRAKLNIVAGGIEVADLITQAKGGEDASRGANPERTTAGNKGAIITAANGILDREARELKEKSTINIQRVFKGFRVRKLLQEEEELIKHTVKRLNEQTARGITAPVSVEGDDYARLRKMVIAERGAAVVSAASDARVDDATVLCDRYAQAFYRGAQPTDMRHFSFDDKDKEAGEVYRNLRLLLLSKEVRNKTQLVEEFDPEKYFKTSVFDSEGRPVINIDALKIAVNRAECAVRAARVLRDDEVREKPSLDGKKAVVATVIGKIIEHDETLAAKTVARLRGLPAGELQLEVMINGVMLEETGRSQTNSDASLNGLLASITDPEDKERFCELFKGRVTPSFNITKLGTLEAVGRGVNSDSAAAAREDILYSELQAIKLSGDADEVKQRKFKEVLDKFEYVVEASALLKKASEQRDWEAEGVANRDVNNQVVLDLVYQKMLKNSRANRIAQLRQAAQEREAAEAAAKLAEVEAQAKASEAEKREAAALAVATHLAAEVEKLYRLKQEGGADVDVEVLQGAILALDANHVSLESIRNRIREEVDKEAFDIFVGARSDAVSEAVSFLGIADPFITNTENATAVNDAITDNVSDKIAKINKLALDIQRIYRGRTVRSYDVKKAREAIRAVRLGVGLNPIAAAEAEVMVGKKTKAEEEVEWSNLRLGSDSATAETRAFFLEMKGVIGEGDANKMYEAAFTNLLNAGEGKRPLNRPAAFRYLRDAWRKDGTAEEKKQNLEEAIRVVERGVIEARKDVIYIAKAAFDHGVDEFENATDAQKAAIKRYKAKAFEIDEFHLEGNKKILARRVRIIAQREVGGVEDDFALGNGDDGNPTPDQKSLKAVIKSLNDVIKSLDKKDKDQKRLEGKINELKGKINELFSDESGFKNRRLALSLFEGATNYNEILERYRLARSAYMAGKVLREVEEGRSSSIDQAAAKLRIFELDQSEQIVDYEVLRTPAGKITHAAKRYLDRTKHGDIAYAALLATVEDDRALESRLVGEGKSLFDALYEYKPGSGNRGAVQDILDLATRNSGLNGEALSTIDVAEDVDFPLRQARLNQLKVINNALAGRVEAIIKEPLFANHKRVHQILGSAFDVNSDDGQLDLKKIKKAVELIEAAVRVGDVINTMMVDGDIEAYGEKDAAKRAKEYLKIAKNSTREDYEKARLIRKRELIQEAFEQKKQVRDKALEDDIGLVADVVIAKGGFSERGRDEYIRVAFEEAMDVDYMYKHPDSEIPVADRAKLNSIVDALEYEDGVENGVWVTKEEKKKKVIKLFDDLISEGKALKYVTEGLSFDGDDQLIGAPLSASALDKLKDRIEVIRHGKEIVDVYFDVGSLIGVSQEDKAKRIEQARNKMVHPRLAGEAVAVSRYLAKRSKDGKVKEGDLGYVSVDHQNADYRDMFAAQMDTERRILARIEDGDTFVDFSVGITVLFAGRFGDMKKTIIDRVSAIKNEKVAFAIIKASLDDIDGGDNEDKDKLERLKAAWKNIEDAVEAANTFKKAQEAYVERNIRSAVVERGSFVTAAVEGEGVDVTGVFDDVDSEEVRREYLREKFLSLTDKEKRAEMDGVYKRERAAVNINKAARGFLARRTGPDAEIRLAIRVARKRGLLSHLNGYGATGFYQADSTKEDTKYAAEIACLADIRYKKLEAAEKWRLENEVAINDLKLAINRAPEVVARPVSVGVVSDAEVLRKTNQERLARITSQVDALFSDPRISNDDKTSILQNLQGFVAVDGGGLPAIESLLEGRRKALNEAPRAIPEAHAVFGFLEAAGRDGLDVGGLADSLRKLRVSDFSLEELANLAKPEVLGIAGAGNDTPEGRADALDRVRKAIEQVRQAAVTAEILRDAKRIYVDIKKATDVDFEKLPSSKKSGYIGMAIAQYAKKTARPRGAVADTGFGGGEWDPLSFYGDIPIPLIRPHVPARPPVVDGRIPADPGGDVHHYHHYPDGVPGYVVPAPGLPFAPAPAPAPGPGPGPAPVPAVPGAPGLPGAPGRDGVGVDPAALAALTKAAEDAKRAAEEAARLAAEGKAAADKNAADLQAQLKLLQDALAQKARDDDALEDLKERQTWRKGFLTEDELKEILRQDRLKGVKDSLVPGISGQRRDRAAIIEENGLPVFVYNNDAEGRVAFDRQTEAAYGKLAWESRSGRRGKYQAKSFGGVDNPRFCSIAGFIGRNGEPEEYCVVTVNATGITKSFISPEVYNEQFLKVAQEEYKAELERKVALKTYGLLEQEMPIIQNQLFADDRKLLAYVDGDPVLKAALQAQYGGPHYTHNQIEERINHLAANPPADLDPETAKSRKKWLVDFGKLVEDGDLVSRAQYLLRRAGSEHRAAIDKVSTRNEILRQGKVFGDASGVGNPNHGITSFIYNYNYANGRYPTTEETEQEIIRLYNDTVRGAVAGTAIPPMNPIAKKWLEDVAANRDEKLRIENGFKLSDTVAADLNDIQAEIPTLKSKVALYRAEQEDALGSTTRARSYARMDEKIKQAQSLNRRVRDLTPTEVDSMMEGKFGITKTFSDNSHTRASFVNIANRPLPIAPCDGIHISRSSDKEEVTVVATGKITDKNNTVMLHVPGSDNWYVEGFVCLKDGPVEVYKNGKVVTEEHKRGDFVINERTLRHYDDDKGKFDEERYSVDSTKTQKGAMVLNAGKSILNVATLGIAKIIPGFDTKTDLEKKAGTEQAKAIMASMERMKIKMVSDLSAEPATPTESAKPACRAAVIMMEGQVVSSATKEKTLAHLFKGERVDAVKPRVGTTSEGKKIKFSFGYARDGLNAGDADAVTDAIKNKTSFGVVSRPFDDGEVGDHYVRYLDSGMLIAAPRSVGTALSQRTKQLNDLVAAIPLADPSLDALRLHTEDELKLVAKVKVYKRDEGRHAEGSIDSEGFAIKRVVDGREKYYDLKDQESVRECVMDVLTDRKEKEVRRLHPGFNDEQVQEEARRLVADYVRDQVGEVNAMVNAVGVDFINNSVRMDGRGGGATHIQLTSAMLQPDLAARLPKEMTEQYSEPLACPYLPDGVELVAKVVMNRGGLLKKRSTYGLVDQDYGKAHGDVQVEKELYLRRPIMVKTGRVIEGEDEEVILRNEAGEPQYNYVKASSNFNHAVGSPTKLEAALIAASPTTIPPADAKKKAEAITKYIAANAKIAVSVEVGRQAEVGARAEVVAQKEDRLLGVGECIRLFPAIVEASALAELEVATVDAANHPDDPRKAAVLVGRKKLAEAAVKEVSAIDKAYEERVKLFDKLTAAATSIPGPSPKPIAGKTTRVTAHQRLGMARVGGSAPITVGGDVG